MLPLYKQGYPHDLRFEGTPSDVVVYDAKTGKVKRIEPGLSDIKRVRLPLKVVKGRD